MNGPDNLLGIAFSASHLRSARNTANQAYQNALANNQLLMQQAGMANTNALANALAAHQPSNVTPIRPERTPEQIREQLEARMAELEREAQKPERVYSCASCRWSENGTHLPYCYQPLITGLKGKRAELWAYDLHPRSYNELCGPEKALWEPIPSRLQRIKEWVYRIIEKLEA